MCWIGIVRLRRGSWLLGLKVGCRCRIERAVEVGREATFLVRWEGWREGERGLKWDWEGRERILVEGGYKVGGVERGVMGEYLTCGYDISWRARDSSDKIGAIGYLHPASDNEKRASIYL